MASPAPHPSEFGRSDAHPPAADPDTVRARLGQDLVDVFDRQWEQVLEEAKRTKSLTGVHDLITHWRHIAFQEMRAPGTYHRLMARADAIGATGRPTPGSVAGADVRAAISARLSEAGLPDPRDRR